MAYNYTKMLPFERSFDPEPSTVWMKANWGHSLTLSAIYMILIFGGERFMKNRKPWNMNRWLIFWNWLLAIFSIAGSVRLTPHFVATLYSHGFYHSVCIMDFTQTVTGFWTQMFGLSKAIELIDTAFIVLRKRPLIFLHWYHHVSVLVYTWHAYKDHTSVGRWYVYMNYVVHAFMYTYYALRACDFRPAKWVPMTLTTMQISQMVVGFCIAVYVYYSKVLQGRPCHQTIECLYFSLVIYSSYFILFAHFFYNAYIKKNNKYQAPSSQKSSKRIVVEPERRKPLSHANGFTITDVQSKKER